MTEHTSAYKIHTAPGIGTPGEIVVSNYGTRAVLVNDAIIRDPSQLAHNYALLTQQPGKVNRILFKSISAVPFPQREPIGGLITEACIPFKSAHGEELFWLVAGLNHGERSPDEDLIRQQRSLIGKIFSEDKYEPQPGSKLLEYARQAVPNFTLMRINNDNFMSLRKSLEVVYDEAFGGNYPYDVVGEIGASCETNVYVAAVADNKVLSVTGAEITTPGGVKIAEVGDSASKPGLKGFGALVKRYLLQTLALGSAPNLCFTDSRISDQGSVIAANRRAGFFGDGIILPWHTHIASLSRDPGHTRIIKGVNGTEFPVENMTMTWVDLPRIMEILSTFGPIPNF